MSCKISRDGYEPCAAMAQFLDTKSTQGFRSMITSGQRIENGQLVKVPVVVGGIMYGQGRGTNTMLNVCPWCGASLTVDE